MKSHVSPERALPAGLGQTRSPQTTHDTETHTRGTRTTTIMTMLTTMISTTGDIIAGPRTQTTPQRAQVIGQWSQVIDHRSWNRSEACHLHANHRSWNRSFARILDRDIHVARVARESGACAAHWPGSNPQPTNGTPAAARTTSASTRSSTSARRSLKPCAKAMSSPLRADRPLDLDARPFRQCVWGLCT